MILDEIHNHYEKLVFDEVIRIQAIKGESYSEEKLVDVVCIALNNLPARYVRHSVDFSYFLTNEEREEMNARVSKAVTDAFNLVSEHPTRG